MLTMLGAQARKILIVGCEPASVAEAWAVGAGRARSTRPCGCARLVTGESAQTPAAARTAAEQAAATSGIRPPAAR